MSTFFLTSPEDGGSTSCKIYGLTGLFSREHFLQSQRRKSLRSYHWPVILYPWTPIWWRSLTDTPVRMSPPDSVEQQHGRAMVFRKRLRTEIDNLVFILFYNWNYIQRSQCWCMPVTVPRVICFNLGVRSGVDCTWDPHFAASRTVLAAVAGRSLPWLPDGTSSSPRNSVHDAQHNRLPPGGFFVGRRQPCALQCDSVPSATIHRPHGTPGTRRQLGLPPRTQGDAHFLY